MKTVGEQAQEILRLRGIIDSVAEHISIIGEAPKLADLHERCWRDLESEFRRQLPPAVIDALLKLGERRIESYTQLAGHGNFIVVYWTEGDCHTACISPLGHTFWSLSCGNYDDGTPESRVMVGLFDPDSNEPVIEYNKPYITITKGMSGWFAVHMWWNPEDGGFWEPYTTGIGRYKTPAEAIKEGKEWAGAEELAFREPVLEDANGTS